MKKEQTPKAPAQRPPRPINYSLPQKIQLEPSKRPMRKAEWRLSINDKFVGGFQNKAAAIDFLQKRIARASFSDQQLYDALRHTHGLVLNYPYEYNDRFNDGTFTDRHDKHGWHEADEVLMLFWLHKELNK